MNATPVTFNTYRTVFLQNDSSLVAIPRLIRDFARRRGLHSTTAMVFMIATMIFILVFPSFASAMTGYSGRLKSYIPDASNNYISFDGFRSVLYVIHDGWRIGKTGDYVVTYNPIYGKWNNLISTSISRFDTSWTDEPILDTTYFERNWDYSCSSESHSSEVQEQCFIQSNVTNCEWEVFLIQDLVSDVSI